MSESSGLQPRYPDPNRPLTPAWNGGIGDPSGHTGGSFWTRGLRGRDRGPTHQGVAHTPGASLLKSIAIELALTLKAAVIWSVFWTAVGLGILYGLLGLVSLTS